MSRQLSSIDLHLLSTAVRCVTQFDTAFANEIWHVSKIAVKRRLQKLERKGVIKSRNILGSSPPPIEKPLCVWRPGESLPPAGGVSYQARKRWKTLPVVVKRVYYATNLGRGLIGRSPIAPPKDIHATHDLGLTSTFLKFRSQWPKLVSRCWFNESEYAHHRGRCVKVEDAMLRMGDKILLMVDFAGSYRPDRIKALLDHARFHNVPIAIY